MQSGGPNLVSLELNSHNDNIVNPFYNLPGGMGKDFFFKEGPDQHFQYGEISRKISKNTKL